eukprot:5582339-Pyramimonas_sp.AAC.1
MASTRRHTCAEETGAASHRQEMRCPTKRVGGLCAARGSGVQHGWIHPPPTCAQGTFNDPSMA